MTSSTTLSDRSALVIEDEVIVALEIADSLQDLGIGDVRVAHNLAMAEREIELRLPDFAILDVNLGRGEKTAELGKVLASKGVSVVFASGYNKAELSADIQPFHFIEKPIIGRDLARRLQTLFDLA